MARLTRRHAIAVFGAALASTAPAPVPRPRPPRLSPAEKVRAAMEGFRKAMPPDNRGLFAGTGMSVAGMEPYTMPHLDQVAKGLGVKTRSECRVLLAYLEDSDVKLRYIAVRALADVTDAFPGGLSVTCVTDTSSESHRKTAARFIDLIERLPP